MLDLQRIRNEHSVDTQENDKGQQALDKWMISPQIMILSSEMVSHKEILGDILTSLKIEVPEIQVTLIVSIEGPIIASKRFDYKQDERVIEAMTAALVSVAEQATLELNKGELTEFIIRSSHGLIFIKRLSEDHLLIILTQAGVRLELLEDVVDQVIPKIGKHLFSQR